MLLFAKAPEPTRVKTRLIPVLGPEAAADLQSWMLLRAVHTAVAAGLGPVEIWCSPSRRHSAFRGLALPRGVCLADQRGKDLGARMLWAARWGLARSDTVLLMGADCPVLKPAHLVRTAVALRGGRYDAAMIPAADGGYVLLGIRRPEPALFRGIYWGTNTVAAVTRQRMRSLRWSWLELETLWDVDRPDDLARLNRLEPTRD